MEHKLQDVNSNETEYKQENERLAKVSSIGANPFELIVVYV